MTDATTISVSGDASYDITVGRGILSTLSGTLPPAARKVLVIHPPTLAEQAEHLRAPLVTDREVLLAEVVLEKFGGDSVAETRRNLDGYLAAIPAELRTASASDAALGAAGA